MELEQEIEVSQPAQHVGYKKESPGSTSPDPDYTTPAPGFGGMAVGGLAVGGDAGGTAIFQPPTEVVDQRFEVYTPASVREGIPLDLRTAPQETDIENLFQGSVTTTPLSRQSGFRTPQSSPGYNVAAQKVDRFLETNPQHSRLREDLIDTLGMNPEFSAEDALRVEMGTLPTFTSAAFDPLAGKVRLQTASEQVFKSDAGVQQEIRNTYESVVDRFIGQNPEFIPNREQIIDTWMSDMGVTSAEAIIAKLRAEGHPLGQTSPLQETFVAREQETVIARERGAVEDDYDAWNRRENDKQAQQYYVDSDIKNDIVTAQIKGGGTFVEAAYRAGRVMRKGRRARAASKITPPRGRKTKVAKSSPLSKYYSKRLKKLGVDKDEYQGLGESDAYALLKNKIFERSGMEFSRFENVLVFQDSLSLGTEIRKEFDRALGENGEFWSKLDLQHRGFGTGTGVDFLSSIQHLSDKERNKILRGFLKTIRSERAVGEKVVGGKAELTRQGSGKRSKSRTRESPPRGTPDVPEGRRAPPPTQEAEGGLSRFTSFFGMGGGR